MNQTNQAQSGDPIYDRFLGRQYVEGFALAADSDLLTVLPSPITPPHFLVEYRCKGLVREADGSIAGAERFQVGIWFPPDYLRRVDPFEILRFFGPSNIWHPNISDRAPFLCIGRLVPGTPLVDILYQIWDILVYAKFNPREDDCLNRAACSWARDHQHLFPLDRRPIKRRKIPLEVSPS